MGTMKIFAAVLLLVDFIHCSTLSFSIEEEKAIDTIVGNIAVNSGLSSNMSGQDFNMLEYKRVSTNNENSVDLFNIVETTGDIKTTTVIDREEICKLKQTCVITFDVAVSSPFSNFFALYTIEISIIDKNDNVPTFPKSTITLEIHEDDSIGTLYSLDSAQDKDIGINSIQGYEISPLNSTFDLNVERNLDQSFILRVELRQKLDREVDDFYQFHVTAKDGGSPPNIGTMTVDVKVIDANDNKPEFQSDYNISIKENFSVGNTLLQLLATDKDIGENGRVFYRFSPHQSDLDNIQQVFSLNSETGKINLKQAFDYGQKNLYKFFVDASDHGTDPQWSQTLVTIRVEDDGNNPPHVTFSYLVSKINSNTVNISEAEKVGKAIAIVNVQDSDSGKSGQVTCVINNDKFELQSLSSGKYAVIIKQILDRETADTHTITVTCNDQGNPPMTTQENFTVQLADENDCTPMFNVNYAYFAAISENSTSGSLVTQVTASDCDAGHNSIIRYFLHADGVDSFVINDITGIINTKKVFDREINPRLTFRVLAVDSGSRPLTGTATVVVNVTDVNDNSPTFNVTAFNFHVLENQDAQTLVGKLTAFDLDEGENARLTFSLVGNNDDVPFHVYPNGTIMTTQKLNREDKGEYRFRIVVSDHGIVPKVAQRDVRIMVADGNDHYPVIHFPNSNNKTLAIVYLESVGSVIATVNASDADSGINADLAYSIVAGNQLGIFDINKHGQIILASTHMIKEDTVFPVVISVKDKGVNPRETTQDVFIVLVYANMAAVSPVKDNTTGNKYVVISAVVVAFTALVSAVIIAIIIILRRNDKKLAEQSRREKVKHANGDVFTNGTVSYDPNHGDLSRKKKKEVSFSLEDDLDNAFDASSFSYDDRDHNSMSKFEKPSKNNTMQFQQFLIQPDKQIKSLQKAHDTGSDTSAETIGSDSGRGGSESELPNSANNPDDSRAFGYNNRDFHKCSSPFDSHGRPNRPFSDNYSNSAKNSGGLTPRETFERKHKLNSSTRRDNNQLPDRPQSDEWSPSYV
ncbi:protocadherin-7-like [Mytilus trossulus]|uniref:protocadherin-7-like n=1 Tax=Mytilus trossulus TaxID=6551 RepID=UPI00300644C7